MDSGIASAMHRHHDLTENHVLDGVSPEMVENGKRRVYELLARKDLAVLADLLPYAPQLEVVLRRRFGTLLDPEDVKDIVAESLVEAVLHGDSFQPKQALLTTWLNVRAHYAALTFLRRHPEISARAPTDLEKVVNPVQIDHALLHDENPSAYVAVALARLSPTHATMLVEHYYQGFTEASIAARHRITVDTVRSQLSRARQALKRNLAAS